MADMRPRSIVFGWWPPLAEVPGQLLSLRIRTNQVTISCEQDSYSIKYVWPCEAETNNETLITRCNSVWILKKARSTSLHNSASSAEVQAWLHRVNTAIRWGGKTLDGPDSWDGHSSSSILLFVTQTLPFGFAAPTTPMWGKKSAAASDLSLQSATKERPPTPHPPSVPGLRALNGPAAGSSVRPI